MLLYNHCSYRGGDKCSINTVSAKSIMKTIVVLDMPNVPTVEEIYLAFILNDQCSHSG